MICQKIEELIRMMGFCQILCFQTGFVAEGTESGVQFNEITLSDGVSINRELSQLIPVYTYKYITCSGASYLI